MFNFDGEEYGKRGKGRGGFFWELISRQGCMRDLLGMLGCILGYPACNLNRSMIVKMNTHILEIQKYSRLMIWSLPVTIPLPNSF